MVILLSLNLRSWSLHNEILKAVKLFMCIIKVGVLDAYLSPIPPMIADYMGSVVVGCISAFQFQQKELSVAS